MTLSVFQPHNNITTIERIVSHMKPGGKSPLALYPLLSPETGVRGFYPGQFVKLYIYYVNVTKCAAYQHNLVLRRRTSTLFAAAAYLEVHLTFRCANVSVFINNSRADQPDLRDIPFITKAPFEPIYLIYFHYIKVKL
jgi:hypothetical protein